MDGDALVDPLAGINPVQRAAIEAQADHLSMMIETGKTFFDCPRRLAKAYVSVLCRFPNVIDRCREVMADSYKGITDLRNTGTTHAEALGKIKAKLEELDVAKLIAEGTNEIPQEILEVTGMYVNWAIVADGIRVKLLFELYPHLRR